MYMISNMLEMNTHNCNCPLTSTWCSTADVLIVNLTAERTSPREFSVRTLPSTLFTRGIAWRNRRLQVKGFRWPFSLEALANLLSSLFQFLSVSFSVFQSFKRIFREEGFVTNLFSLNRLFIKIYKDSLESEEHFEARRSFQRETSKGKCRKRLREQNLMREVFY